MHGAAESRFARQAKRRCVRPAGIAGFIACQVEGAYLIGISHRQFRHFHAQLRRLVAQAAENQASADVELPLSEQQTLVDFIEHLLEREPISPVQLRRESHLAVDHSVGREVFHQLVRDARQALRRLHQRHRKIHPHKIVGQIVAELGRNQRRPQRLVDLDLHLLRQLGGSFQTHAAIEMAVQLDLGELREVRRIRHDCVLSPRAHFARGCV